MEIINQDQPPSKVWIDLGFKTKKAWEDAVKKIKATPHGVSISGPDHALLLATFWNHPEAIAKAGCGIRCFVTGPGAGGWTNGTCFYVVRWDGTKEDFSYKQCLQPMTHRTLVSKTMRVLVSPDIIAWRDRQFDAMGLAICGESGQALTRKEAHVDHRYPKTFSSLQGEWASVEHVDLDTVPVQREGLWGFKDPTLGVSWVQFHRENADLQILRSDLNMARGNRDPEAA